MPRLAIAAAGLAALSMAMPSGAQAQRSAPTVSTPVVQALPSRESLQLNSALAKLGRNPRDVQALVDAGDAASAMGDFEAAIGFFKRAGQIEENNARVKAGLAGALVNDGDPFAALPLFDEAQRAGVDPVEIAGDRGLAFDLVGDNVSAQRYYRQALGKGKDEEISRRLAISLAISGREREVEHTLLPLLRNQDKAAWRARAFSLAILGKTKQSIKITETLLPARLAKNITPYLEYMPRLTPAQQAAAANLGRFPRSSEIGRDDPRVALFGRNANRVTKVAAAGTGLVPTGKPLGQGNVRRASDPKTAARLAQADAKAKKAAEKRTARIAPPEPKPERVQGPASEPVLASATKPQSPAEIMEEATPAKAVPKKRKQSKTIRKVATAPEMPAPRPSEVLADKATPAERPTTAKPPVPAAATPPPVATAPPGAVVAASPEVAAVPVPKPDPATAPKVAAATARPGFDLASLPVRSAAPSTSEPAKPSFTDMFGDIGTPEARVAPKAGAVDIRKIEPAKPQAKPVAQPEPAKPSHPSRIWVQLGIGQNKSALSFDWRRFSRKVTEPFSGKTAHVSRLNQTNRLLAGPFESRKAANSFISDLREGGIEGPYLWTSPAGQVVDEL